ncbi:hypothetical protein Tco_1203338 [Tanacetum coccineum]
MEEEEKVDGIVMMAYEEFVEEEALMAYEDDAGVDTQWYLDTAARNHMRGDKGSFLEMKEVVDGSVLFGDEAKTFMYMPECLRRLMVVVEMEVADKEEEEEVVVLVFERMAMVMGRVMVQVENSKGKNGRDDVCESVTINDLEMKKFNYNADVSILAGNSFQFWMLLVVSNPLNQVLSTLVDQESAHQIEHDNLNNDGVYMVDEFEVQIMEPESSGGPWKTKVTISMQTSENALTVIQQPESETLLAVGKVTETNKLRSDGLGNSKMEIAISRERK